MTINLRFSASLFVLWLVAMPAAAHPVLKDTHDRTIVVRLQNGDAPKQIRVRVEYRLEVDETTVWLGDMKPFQDEANPLEYRKEPLKYYAIFTKIYAPIFAERLVARVNDKPIPDFRCVSRKERLQDDDGMSLGHLRCDFVFETSFDIEPGVRTKFFFHDQTYLSNGIAPEAGMLSLTVINETGLEIESKIEADESLKKRPVEKLEPAEEDRLRKVTIVLAPTVAPAPVVEAEPAAPPREPRESHDERFSLLRLLLQTDYGFGLTLLLAFFFGAAHALTPGHGKTLVAAYLVGERGTVWHALYLGFVTTLTHTGVVMAIAIILTLLPPDRQQVFMKWIENGLGLVVGLIIVGMGFWLFLQRVAGRADHFHLDGGHHHHHGAQDRPTPRSLNWWGITVLGMTGGIIPCWDAVGVLAIAVGTNQVWLVLPAVLVFSAGLAVVLVIIGIFVVQVPRFVEARFGSGRMLRALPIVSAILVTLMGLWLCYEGTRGM